MSTITKEWLQQTIADMESTRDDIPFGFDVDGNNMLAALKMALASLEAEPVAWTSQRSLDVRDKITAFTCKEGAESYGNKSAWESVVPLYAAQPAPAPVVPEGLRVALSNAGIAAPESDEMLAATCDKHIQALVTWVRNRKPFQPVPVDGEPRLHIKEAGNSLVTPEQLHWPPLRVVVNGERWHLYSPEYHYGDSTFSFYLYARNRAEAEEMLSAIRANVVLPEGEIIGFSDHEPTEAEMFSADTNNVADNYKIH